MVVNNNTENNKQPQAKTFGILSFREGKELEHLSEIYSDFLPLIKSRVARYSSGDSAEFDDLVQEASIGFLEAVRSYRKELSGFTSFATLCIDRKLFDCFKHNARKSAVPKHGTVPLDGADGDAAAVVSADNPEAIFIAQEECAKFIATVESRLSDLEFKVFRLFAKGMSYREISNKLSINEKAVNNAMQRIRLKLKQKSV